MFTMSEALYKISQLPKDAKVIIGISQHTPNYTPDILRQKLRYSTHIRFLGGEAENAFDELKAGCLIRLDNYGNIVTIDMRQNLKGGLKNEERLCKF